MGDLEKVKHRILIIDDSPEDREIYKRHLKKNKDAECVIIEAGSGEEGLTMFLGENPDCVLLDLNLPDIDGLELLEKMSEETGNTSLPVVMLTGQGDESIAVTAMKRGCQDYMSKNMLTDQSLYRAIANTMEKISLYKKVEEQHRELEQKVNELQAVLAHVKQLQGLLPICMHCKKIRNDENSWEQLEDYISRRSEAEFSHSICSECTKKHYPELTE